MLKHRRMRILLVLLVSWAATAGVQKFRGELPWSTAASQAVLWAGLVAFVWWFAEWTQVQRRRT
ncbi:hypothetical protein OG875_30370 [Streptomyces sp. NBC_01498]|uniref:hypothetical protein n=1 Tax=Streptomyces sp. NBC_01498 TaxID=2975870 RepID=UPI002E7AEF62|nr:hypothetical protein [Streptomyces sp. NBC_01498]WTL28513.1 hypothetical protein OG875_30370 [Streptomyces sp. NBC_01498]